MTQRAVFIEAMVKANGGIWPDLEQLVTATYREYVRLGDLVLDIGVNHGVHLLHLARLVGGDGCVIGVEAVPAFADYARKLILADGDGLSDRVVLHTCAVSSEVGVKDFFVTKITDGGLSGLKLRPVISNDPFDQIQVDVRTIDMLLPQDRRVRFVKIDIEGGEYDALRGAPALLAQQPLMTFEFDSSAPGQFGFQADDFFGLLRRAGYVVYDIFGFEVESGAAMVEAVVWNFVAIPPGLDPASVMAPSRRLLEAQLPDLAAFTRDPSADLRDTVVGAPPVVEPSTPDAGPWNFGKVVARLKSLARIRM